MNRAGDRFSDPPPGIRKTSCFLPLTTRNHPSGLTHSSSNHGFRSNTLTQSSAYPRRRLRGRCPADVRGLQRHPGVRAGPGLGNTHGDLMPIAPLQRSRTGVRPPSDPDLADRSEGPMNQKKEDVGIPPDVYQNHSTGFLGFLPLFAGVFATGASSAGAGTAAFLGFLPLFAWGLAFASGLKQRNQSRHLTPSV